MPIATITYDLDDPDDRRAYKLYSMAGEMHSVLCDFDARLRYRIKHNGNEVEANTQQDLRDDLLEMLESYGIDVWSE